MKKGKSEKVTINVGDAWRTDPRRRAPILNISLFHFFTFSLFAFSLLTAVSAQDDPPEIAPPPLKIISRDERMSLDAVRDIKARTKLILELMNTRVTAAEKLNAGKEFDAMFRELGGFHALMDNSLDFLQKQDTDERKVLDNFKRVEIGLRAFAGRIEAIRRDLPLRYDDYPRRLLKYIREARTRASEPLFDDTVVPGAKPEE